jgi:Na+/proline symporter
MNPQEPQEPNAQQPLEPSYVQPLVAESPQKSKKRLALILIIGPTSLFILAIVVSIVSNLLFNTQMSEGELFNQVPVGKTVFNIIIFLLSAVAFLTWLPGLIIGIILLAKQSK